MVLFSILRSTFFLGTVFGTTFRADAPVFTPAVANFNIGGASCGYGQDHGSKEGKLIEQDCPTNAAENFSPPESPKAHSRRAHISLADFQRRVDTVSNFLQQSYSFPGTHLRVFLEHQFQWVKKTLQKHIDMSEMFKKHISSQFSIASLWPWEEVGMNFHDFLRDTLSPLESEVIVHGSSLETAKIVHTLQQWSAYTIEPSAKTGPIVWRLQRALLHSFFLQSRQDVLAMSPQEQNIISWQINLLSERLEEAWQTVHELWDRKLSDPSVTELVMAARSRPKPAQRRARAHRGALPTFNEGPENAEEGYSADNMIVDA